VVCGGCGGEGGAVLCGWASRHSAKWGFNRQCGAFVWAAPGSVIARITSHVLVANDGVHKVGRVGRTGRVEPQHAVQAPSLTSVGARRAGPGCCGTKASAPEMHIKAIATMLRRRVCPRPSCLVSPMGGWRRQGPQAAPSRRPAEG
jgi:hypothetical protein